MKTTYLPLLIIAAILAAATWTARITTSPASAVAHAPTLRKSANPSGTVAHPEGAASAARSPLEIAKAIHSARASRDNAEAIGVYLVESRRERTLQFLAAIDDVLAADTSLHDAVRKAHGVSLPESWNLRIIQDNVGLFSTNVSFISESINGAEARVTIQEGSHVPLVHARFTRVNGDWLHEPDTIAPGVVPALGRVAEVIRDVEKSVDEGAPFESLADAFTFRIMPRIQDVARAGEASQAE